MSTSPSPPARPLRIGLFTHSVNPRGGVVHCLELGEALANAGHDVVVHAPAAPGPAFFRPARRAAHRLDPGRAGRRRVGRPRAANVVTETAAHLRAAARPFDVYHAHDGISGNALVELTDQGAIPGFVRTVHHLDDFADPWLRAAQDRSVTAASHCLCVSGLWRGTLLDRYGIDAAVVGNGVDLSRFTPAPDPSDAILRERLMAGGFHAPVFLSVGGVERRKNTLTVLRVPRRPADAAASRCCSSPGGPACWIIPTTVPSSTGNWPPRGREWATRWSLPENCLTSRWRQRTV